MQHALSVVRTSVEDVTWTINGGMINELWTGADDDAGDDGTIKHCTVNVLGGTIRHLNKGYSSHVEGAFTMGGTYSYEAYINHNEAEACNLIPSKYVTVLQLEDEIASRSFYIPFDIQTSQWDRGSAGQRPVLRYFFEKMPFTEYDLISLQSFDSLFQDYEIRIVKHGVINYNKEIVDYDGSSELSYENDGSYYSYLDIECDCDKSNPVFPNEKIDCMLYVIKSRAKGNYADRSIYYVNDPKWLAPESEGSSSSNIVTQDGNPIGTQDGHGLTIFD